MPPRPRQRSTILPSGIKPDALPPYVYFDAAGRGRWVLREKVDGKLKAYRLAGADATIAQIWSAYKELTKPQKSLTLRDLVLQFERSPAWSELAESTRRDYRISAKQITSFATEHGQLAGDTRPSDWTPGSVRTYVERRAETSRSRANHDLRYLRRLFAWAYERDLMPSNPARGVKGLKEAPRQRYVTDAEYIAFLTFAAPRYPYLVPVSELAYLCRLRISEVCDLRRADMRPEGLFAARRKGSKDALTGWTERLRAACQGALSLHGSIASLYLIPGTSGGRMLESTIQTAWQRAMVDWALKGNERFSTHDLKRKGVSDADGDKLAASGHRSAAMLRVYDVLPSRSPATR
jgi:integrase